MRAPRTPFTTEFRGSGRALGGRLSNLFCQKTHRRGVLLMAAVILAAGLAGSLVSCTLTQPEPQSTDAQADVLLADLALEQAGVERVPEDALTLLFAQTVERKTAYAYAYDSGHHAGGFANLLLFTADVGVGELVGPVRLLSSDENTLDTWTDNDGLLHLLYTTCVTYQGWQDCGGGHLILGGEGWQRLWPAAWDSEDYAAFWRDRKGVLGTEHTMDLYDRGPWMPADPEGSSPQWVNAEQIDFGASPPANTTALPRAAGAVDN